MELLVRDWQNFDDDEGDLNEIIKEMNVYLQEILDEKSQKDLKEVREQIHDCFEKISCFLLPHPGHDVTSKKYNGDINKIRTPFKRLLSEYVQRVFLIRYREKYAMRIFNSLPRNMFHV